MRALREQGVDIVYIGGVEGAERRYLRDVSGLVCHGIVSGKLRRYWSWRNLADALRVVRGIGQSFRLLGSIRPGVYFFQGRASEFSGGVRGMDAAHSHRCARVRLFAGVGQSPCHAICRCALHEFSHAPPALSAWGTHPHRLTDSPGIAEWRRATWQGTDRARGRGLPVVLVTGGSLGADALNAVVVEAAPELVKQCSLIHVCGPGRQTDLEVPGYRQYEYVGEDWGDLLAAADLVVSRAGANTLFELLTLGKPNLLVPLPALASRGDQIENAQFAADAGFSRVIRQEQLTAGALLRAVQAMLEERQAWAERVAGFAAPPAVEMLCAVLKQAGSRRKLR